MRCLPSLFLPSLVLLALAGCTVGPDYVGPPPAGAGAVAAGRFHRAEPDMPATATPAAWWTGFGDAPLAALIARAQANSPDVRAALARIAAARAVLREKRADALPRGSLTSAAIHTELPPGSLGLDEAQGSGDLDGNFFGGGLQASWEPDLTGGKARAKQAATARVAASETDLADARLLLTAEIAGRYVDLRNYQRGLDAMVGVEKVDAALIDLMRERVRLGTASEADLARLAERSEASHYITITLKRETAITLDRLALLTGAAPGALDAELGAHLPMPLPPASVAVGDPASLLRMRPDVRGAERRLAAATADIGVDTAKLFPSVRLFGIIGIGASHLDDLDSSDSFSLITAPTLTWNLFDLGRVRARIARSDARRDEALAVYEETVLAALNDAEASLTRFARQRDMVAAHARALAATAHALAVTGDRRQGGSASEIDVLEARRAWAMSAITHGDAEAEMSRDYVLLQKSLGLGWSPQ